MRVIFTPLAERQIDSLHAYIGRIVALCNGLTTFPLRGQQRDDLLPGLRTTGFERSVTIAFLIIADTVLIEGVFYGGRDFEAAFRGEG